MSSKGLKTGRARREVEALEGCLPRRRPDHSPPLTTKSKPKRDIETIRSIIASCQRCRRRQPARYIAESTRAVGVLYTEERGHIARADPWGRLNSQCPTSPHPTVLRAAGANASLAASAKVRASRTARRNKQRSDNTCMFRTRRNSTEISVVSSLLLSILRHVQYIFVLISKQRLAENQIENVVFRARCFRDFKRVRVSCLKICDL